MSRYSYQEILRQASQPKTYNQLRKQSKANFTKEAIIIQRFFRYYRRRKIIDRMRQLESFLDRSQFKIVIQNSTFEDMIIERLLQDLQIGCSSLQLKAQEQDKSQNQVMEYRTDLLHTIRIAQNQKLVSKVDNLIEFIEQL